MASDGVVRKIMFTTAWLSPVDIHDVAIRVVNVLLRLIVTTPRLSIDELQTQISNTFHVA